MPILSIGKHHINTDRIVTVLSPARRQHDDRTRPNQGVSDTAVAIVLAGSDDLNLFDEDADAFRAWLAGQGQSTHEAELAKLRPAPAPIVTKTPNSPAK